MINAINETINEVLNLNLSDLRGIIKQVKAESIDDANLILLLTAMEARDEVLEILTENLTDYRFFDEQLTVEEKPRPRDPLPAFVMEVENDDPEKEDLDVKKAREEQTGFFG
jgi:hypothetical protein